MQAAVVRDEDLRVVPINVLQSFDLNSGATEPEVVLGPTAHAEVLQFASAGERTAHNGNRSPPDSA